MAVLDLLQGGSLLHRLAKGLLPVPLSYQDASVTLYLGDSFELLNGLPDASVDACVTDPPYGIGFMGREWDTFKPGHGATRKLMHPREREAAKIVSDNPNIDGRHRSPALSPSQIDYDRSIAGQRAFQEWTERWALEVLRVLKPGAYAVVCGAPRSYHRMASGLEDAGFEIRDCFSWLFGSGFPKSLNLGEGLGTALKPAHEPIVLARKPFKGTVKANVLRHGTGAINVDACRIEYASEDDKAAAAAAAQRASQNQNEGRTVYGDYNDGPGSIPGFLDKQDLGRWPSNVLLDEEAAVMLDQQSGELVDGVHQGSRRDPAANMGGYSGGFKKDTRVIGYGGSGGASRFYKIAAADCILCGMSCVEHDTMSACETTSASSAAQRSRTIRRIIDATALSPAHASLAERLAQAAPCVASLCETCEMSIVLALVEIKCSGSPQQASRAFLASTQRSKSSILIPHLVSFAALWVSTDTIPTTPSLSMLFGSVCHAIGSSTKPVSLGSASNQTRFLYSAKPSREERDYGCLSQPTRSAGACTDRADGSAGLSSPRAGAGRTGGHKNFHPTVKPVELMRWLVKLITPPNGTVLDPFTGSGTTGMACRYEQRRFIGIEREAEYMAIAERRIRAVAPLFNEASA